MHVSLEVHVPGNNLPRACWLMQQLYQSLLGGMPVSPDGRMFPGMLF